MGTVTVLVASSNCFFVGANQPEPSLSTEGAGVASHCSGVGSRWMSPLVAMRYPCMESSIPAMCWSPKVPEKVLLYMKTLNALELGVVR